MRENYRMKRWVIALLIMSLCVAGGCGSEAKGSVEQRIDTSTENVSEEVSEAAPEEGTFEEIIVESVAEESTSEENASEEETSGENTSDENTSEENTPEQEAEVVTLDFVDVFGEHYETTIKPDVPKHDYLNDNFSRDGYKLTYEDDNYSSRLGIDVSRHQGKIDWEKVKAQGVEFAFLRIGYRGYGKEGSINLDKRFHENIKGAQDAGIDVGVYFFSQAVSEEEALEEAKFVLDALDGSKLQLPVVYDPESILDDVARTDDVSGEQFTRNTIVFCDSIRENGYEPMIYSNMLWEAFEFDLSQLSEIPVWYADYEEFPQTPYHFVFWQYTNEGRISGIDGEMDYDIQIIKK